MSYTPSNTFYVVVVTHANNDNPIAVHTYGRKQHASGRRTQERNYYRDAKVFQVTYALGCLASIELDYTEYDAKRERKRSR